MFKTVSIVGLCAVISAGILASSAAADVILAPVGEPMETGSWSQVWRASSGSGFNHVQAEIEYSFFENSPSAITNFSNETYSSRNDKYLAVADGDRVGSLDFEIKCGTEMDIEFVLDIGFFDGRDCVDNIKAWWHRDEKTQRFRWDCWQDKQDGCEHHDQEDCDGKDDCQVVPLPASAWMSASLLGILGFGLFIRRRVDARF